MICFLAVIHALIKNCFITKKYLTTHIFRKKQINLLSFNAILSQSKATQSLNIFQRGLRLLTPRLGGVLPESAPQLCWCSLCSQMPDKVLFPYLQHYIVSSNLQSPQGKSSSGEKSLFRFEMLIQV